MTGRRLPDPAEEPTLTVARSARIAGFGLRTAYRAIEEGEWPSIRVGRAIRVPTKRWLDTLGLSEPDSDGRPVGAGQPVASHGEVTARRKVEPAT